MLRSKLFIFVDVRYDKRLRNKVFFIIICGDLKLIFVLIV